VTAGEPNIFEVIRSGDKEAFLRLVTEKFREGAAEGHRQTLAVKAAMAAFNGDNAKALEFLNRPHPELQGALPMQVAGASDEGLAKVIGLVNVIPNSSSATLPS
jgi:uncharacterized protein (DUF2384 family)